MPFKSKAQMRKFAAMVRRGEMSEKTYKEWAAKTRSVERLPERVGRKQKR